MVPGGPAGEWYIWGLLKNIICRRSKTDLLKNLDFQDKYVLRRSQKSRNLGISTNRNKKENEKEDKVALNNKR